MPLVSPQGIFLPLTSENEGAGERHRAALTSFTLSERDALAVRLVGAFHQATATQLREVLYSEVSRERLRQCIQRLCALKLLRPLARRPAGDRGGSGAYVYQLGPAGWWYCGKRGPYAPRTSLDNHALAVFDVYAEVVGVVRGGSAQFIGCELEAAYGHARADIALHLGIPATNKRRRFCIEVEVTRKRQAYIKEKCDHYVAAMRQQEGGILPVVVFAVPHEWIATEIKRTLRAVNGDFREMFRVHLLSEAAAALVA